MPPTGQQIPATLPNFQSFTINGIDYTVQKILSDQSGEARIYLVNAGGMDYVLKLYKPGRHPNHTVLEAIRQMPRGNGLVIDLYAHGVWTAPASGYGYDYELMSYCKGGSLAGQPLKNTVNGEQILRQIAITMAAEIDFCHQHHVLHRDIKPGNFLYTDESHSRFVLTDFGIGYPIGPDGKAVVDKARTPIYAAPETYIVVPNQPFYATPAADFYAMGMTLLALWIGEGMLTANERQLLDDKLEENLPYPTTREMSAHTIQLLKALTRRKAEKRPTFADIERWANGETIYDDAPKTEFRVVFSSKEIAHSPEELAQLMWKNKDLGTSYLYKEQIEQQLRLQERPELALRIREITEDLYPDKKQHNAGLFAACLLLDEGMAYTGINGNRVETAEEIASELTDNEDTYTNELTNADHLLWVYMRSCGNTDLVNSYVKTIRREGVRGVRQLTYILDNSLPYRAELSNYQRITLYSLDDLFDSLHDGVFKSDAVANLIGDDSDHDIATLVGDDFLTWVEERDSTLAGLARSAIVNAPKGTSLTELGWIAAYTMGGHLGYDFQPLTGSNKTQLGTIEEIARQMALEINSNKRDKDSLTEQIDHDIFRHSQLYCYLTARKKYTKQINWIDDCMNLNSSDNQHKAVPYNREMAQMKAVAGLLGGTFPLAIGSMTLHTVADYEKQRDKVNAAAQGYKATQLQDWLALSFQEKPGADLKGGNYTLKAIDYLKSLMRNMPNSIPARKGLATQQAIETAKNKYLSAKGRVKAIQLTAIILGYVPLIIACGYIIYNLIFNIGSDAFRGVMASIGNILGWVIGIGGGLCLCAATPLVGIIGGIILYWLTVWLMGVLVPVVPWLLVGILVVIMIVFYITLFGKVNDGIVNHYNDINLDDGERLATIADAFGTRDRVLPNPIPKDYPMCVYNSSEFYVRSELSGMIKQTVMMIVIAAAVLGLFFWATSGSKSHSDLDEEDDTEMVIDSPDPTGTYNGTFDGRKATLTLTFDTESNIIEGQAVIKYRRKQTQKLRGAFEKNNTNRMILFIVGSNGEMNTNTFYDGMLEYYDSGVGVYSGSFINNEKNTKTAFEFTQE